jgi:hypothetical protein
MGKGKSTTSCENAERIPEAHEFHQNHPHADICSSRTLHKKNELMKKKRPI